MVKQWKQCQTLFFWAPKSLQMVIAAMQLKDTYSLERRRQWQPTPVLLPGESHVLQSMGSQRVQHDWATSLSLFTFTHWRRKRQPTPVFLPGESQGWRSLVGCHLWGRTELDMTEASWSDLAAAALLGRKVMTNLDSILKSRDITFVMYLTFVKKRSI